MAKAQCTTYRLRLFKIGAHLRVIAHKAWGTLSHHYPYQHLFTQRIKPSDQNRSCATLINPLQPRPRKFNITEPPFVRSARASHHDHRDHHGQAKLRIRY